MNKTILWMFAIATLCWCSACQKSYTCKCKDNNVGDSTTVTISAKKRSDAQGDCQARETSVFVNCQLQ